MGVRVAGTSTLHLITSIFGSRILKIYFLHLLFISLLRTLFNIDNGKVVVVLNRKFWPPGSHIFGSCVLVSTVTSL